MTLDDDLLRYSVYVVAVVGQTNIKLSTNYSATVEPERMGYNKNNNNGDDYNIICCASILRTPLQRRRAKSV